MSGLLHVFVNKRTDFIGVLFLSLWVLGEVAGQTTATLTGEVLDKETGKPVPFATVYINATTKGTTADSTGRYRLTNLPVGSMEIVVSAVGYVLNRQQISVKQGVSQNILFRLASDSKALSVVTVTANLSKAYNRHLRAFKKELLGDTPLADKCVIVNAKTIVLDEKNGHLTAKATETLIIDNQALGYRIYYDLLRFDTFRGATYYSGTSRFEEVKPENPKQADRWKWNRQLAYRGSSRHLLASLVAGTYQKEGYMIYQADFLVPANPAIPLFQFVTKQPGMVVSDSLIKPASLPHERLLVSKKPLEIFYTRRRSLSSPYPKIPYAYSLLILPQGRALITDDGWVSQPMGFEIRGDMSSDRLGNLLPSDWKATQTVVDSTEQVLTKGLILKPDSRLDSLTRRAVEQQQAMAPAVFLQIDKGFYLTGDHLWMSGYVVEPQTWLPLSNRTDGNPEIVHTELVSPSGQVLFHQWLSVNEGRISSDFHLSDSLSTGLYTLRAYPSADPSVRPAFERTVTIVNSRQLPVSAASVSDSLDLQFLPEGGHWVASIPSKLGVKVVDRQGYGLSVRGTIEASDGTAPIDFTTDEHGLGVVNLTPRKQVSYRALVKNRPLLQAFNLPPVETKGLVLSVDPLTDSTQIAIEVRTTLAQAECPVYVTVQSRGQLIQQTKLKLQKAYARLVIPASRIPAGLALITLFDSAGVPRSERLIFGYERVDNAQATISTDKPSYKARESITLSLQMASASGEPIAMIGSASITDVDQLPTDSDAATIRTHLLLTGDLRGRVEKPNTYLHDNTQATRQTLDKLLLTHGWRRLSWQAPTDSTVFTQGIALSGQVLTRRQRPIAQANLLLRFAKRSGILYARTVKTDQQGQFRLDGLTFSDTVQVRIRAMNETFKPLTSVIVLNPPGQQFDTLKTRPQPNLTQLDRYRKAAQIRQAAYPAIYREQDVRLLQEVVIRAAKPDEVNARSSSIHGQPDAVIRFDERGRTYSNAYEMMSGKVPGVQVQRKNSADFGSGGYSVRIRGAASVGSPSPPLYVVDGAYVYENESGDALMIVNPAEIERIEVIKNSGGSMYVARGGDGIIAFYSKKWTPMTPKEPLNSSETERTLYGFPVQRQFYAPRYLAESTENQTIIDRRDVLHWRPALATDFRGQTTMPFSLSDVVRRIRVTVQGITNAGQPVFIEKELNVR
jgi:hypothetical protein